MFWTYHVNMRLANRGITRQTIIASVRYYEIIEEYPDDKYFPRYLVYTQFQEKPIHIVFAINIEEDVAHIVTAYVPNAIEWESDFKTRRDRQ